MTALSQTSAIVLAAGLSKRHAGGNKLLRDVHGKPLAAHIADTLAALPLRDRIAVVADDKGPLAEIFASRQFSLAVNPEAESGQGHSLALGVRAAVARYDSKAVLICLADMPFVTAEIIESLVMAANGDYGASVCAVSDHISPPAVFLRRYFSTLTHLEGDAGARKILSALPDVAKIEVAPELLADFDKDRDFQESAG